MWRQRLCKCELQSHAVSFRRDSAGQTAVCVCVWKEDKNMQSNRQWTVRRVQSFSYCIWTCGCTGWRGLPGSGFYRPGCIFEFTSNTVRKQAPGLVLLELWDYSSWFSQQSSTQKNGNFPQNISVAWAEMKNTLHSASYIRSAPPSFTHDCSCLFKSFARLWTRGQGWTPWVARLSLA